MISISDELLHIGEQLDDFLAKSRKPEIEKLLAKLQESAQELAKSWSGSWLGHHAYIYYADFQPPPPGAHFSQEWGLMKSFSPGTSGDWQEYDFDDVRKLIFANAGKPNLSRAKELAKEGRTLFEEKREEVLSILETYLAKRSDTFIERLRNKTKKEGLFTAEDFIKALRPSGNFVSRDSVAVTQGLWKPPHISVIAEVFEIRNPSLATEKLTKLVNLKSTERIGTHVFIGHGQSPLWKDLKDFIQDRLQLPYDEFNRVPVAGVTNIARLSQMIDSAAIAFLVMTGEDEQACGKMHARLNVVHEAGLFQGRLGFTRAIVLLEEGCEEFSNIQGLGQIHFPKNNIKACFEDIRQVLEREELLET